MSAEILTTIPKSGEYQEKHFGENFNSQLWIKFIDNEDLEWVGCFPKQYDTFVKVLTNATNESALIISGGQGFLLDISKKEILYIIDDMPLIESAILTANPEYFLVGACYCIYILNKNGLIKVYDPNFRVDGIHFTEQKEDKAIGYIYLPHSVNQQDIFLGFEFDLFTNELNIDAKIKVRQIEPLKFVNITKTEEK